MKQTRLKSIYKTLITLSCTAFLFACAATTNEPGNLGQLRTEVIRYHDTGLYDQQLAHTIAQAKDYILQQASINEQSGNKKKLAVVLDIDETSLSNYKVMVASGFFSDPNKIKRDQLLANAPAIPPMLSLYKQVTQKNVKVFFVTGRGESERKATIKNLLRAGYSNWAGLYLRPDNYHQASIIPYKTNTRELISKQGYIIVATIGDQYSDIKGGYAERGFKLPNPYYYLP